MMRFGTGQRPPQETRRTTYEHDLVGWTEEQAALVQARRFDELDLDNIAEELRDMGRSEWRELENRLELLLAHMLKRQFQPGKHTRSWDATIDEQRRAIERLFARSPSLKRDLHQTMQTMYRYAARKTVRETGLKPETFPEDLPYSLDEVLREEPPR